MLVLNRYIKITNLSIQISIRRNEKKTQIQTCKRGKIKHYLKPINIKCTKMKY